MISSLANFLTLMFYHGDFPRQGFVDRHDVHLMRSRDRQSRHRAGSSVLPWLRGDSGHRRIHRDAAISGFTHLCNPDSLTIGYLSDAIVRDCTLIDDSADSSDQGLLDSGKQYLKEQMDSVPQPGNTDASTITASNTDLLDSNPSKPTRSRKKPTGPNRYVSRISSVATVRDWTTLSS